MRCVRADRGLAQAGDVDNEQWLTHCTDTIGRGGPYSYRIKLMADQIGMAGVENDRPFP